MSCLHLLTTVGKSTAVNIKQLMLIWRFQESCSLGFNGNCAFIHCLAFVKQSDVGESLNMNTVVGFYTGNQIGLSIYWIFNPGQCCCNTLVSHAVTITNILLLLFYDPFCAHPLLFDHCCCNGINYDQSLIILYGWYGWWLILYEYT